MQPKSWSQVYPQGTKEGDEEKKFFCGKDGASGMARHPTYEWRSTAAIVKESGLPVETVERIIDKYLKLGIIVPSTSRDNHWAYWERVPNKVKKDPKSLSSIDKDKRIKEATN